jgi:hypothetical protein
MKWLKFVVGMLLLALLAACGQASTPTAAPTNLSISARTEPESLAVGETTLIITLQDDGGAPVDGATLRVHGDMDHAGMVSLDREVSASTNGEYRVPFEWTMGGGWLVTVTVRLSDGSEINETFDFFVEAVSSESIINRTNTQQANPTSPETGVNITYLPDKSPMETGDASVTIGLMDEQGSPITDAVVKVTGDMAHQGMMPITGEGEHTGSGQYVVPLRWTMAGDWIVTVNVTLADGQQIEQTFNQEVVMP